MPHLVSDTAETNKCNTREWVYCTFVSRWLQLGALNQVVHQIQILPHPIEFVVFLCGYAMNPVIVPLWIGLFHYTESAASLHMLLPILFCLVTVLVTLLAIEICKRSFHTTRPENKSGDPNSGLTRRYGKLVCSLKSKHSFPSGDSAAAANLCLFLTYYAPVLTTASPGVVWFALLCFLPGVWFARCFYLCHWVEDCLGGTVLAAVLHWTILPQLHAAMVAHITLLPV